MLTFWVWAPVVLFVLLWAGIAVWAARESVLFRAPLLSVASPTSSGPLGLWG